MNHPWIWADFEGETALGLVAFFVLLVGIAGLISLYCASDKTAEPGQSPMKSLVFLLFALILGYVAYSNAYWHLSLRGECHYAVGRVYENSRSKTGRASHYEFSVRGVPFRSVVKVQQRPGWLPLGSRWYVRYATADPEIVTLTGFEVPDSIRAGPFDGWTELPEPPAPPPTPAPPASDIPEAAPEPLTGPSTSPVFRPTADSAVRPLFGPRAVFPRAPISVVPLPAAN